VLPLIQTLRPHLTFYPCSIPWTPDHTPPLYPPLDLLVTGFVVGSAIADGAGHRAGRAGRRGRGGRAFSGRRGRQEAAPLGGYGADAPLDTYAADDELSARDLELQALSANIPGVPGEDYPILAEVPESGFTCDGQVDGGYYADPEAECQVFHICTSDGKGGLGKYSFLCPNGTIFNQNYFICDWWFNFDCSEAETLYSINDDIASERAALAEEGEASDAYGAPEPIEEYAAPVEARDEYAPPPAEYAEYAYDDALPAYDEYVVDEYAAPATDAPATDAPEERLPSYEEEIPAYEAQATYDDGAALPAESGEIIEVVRSGRNRNGRRGRNGRRNNAGRSRSGRRQQGRRQGRNQGGRRSGRQQGRSGRAGFRG